MRIIENEGGLKANERKQPPMLLVLFPFIVASYSLYLGEINAYINFALFSFIVYLLLHYKTDLLTKPERLIFEISHNEILHHFNETQKSDTIELARVSLIRYGNNYIGFEGDKHYSKEIFFPKDYRNKLVEVVDLILKDNPQIKVESNA